MDRALVRTNSIPRTPTDACIARALPSSCAAGAGAAGMLHGTATTQRVRHCWFIRPAATFSVLLACDNLRAQMGRTWFERTLRRERLRSLCDRFV